MAAATPLAGRAAGPDRAVLERFDAINSARLERARAAVTPRQRDVLEMLPLLLHCNHPLLPGYVSSETPHGITGYTPGAQAIRRCRRLIRAFEPERRALARHDIEGLYAIGSAGTIAYSQDSDLDLWLCHHPGLAPGPRAELRRKASAIEQWAAGYGLEVHFFVFAAAELKAGTTLNLSAESSGTTQRYLLLDEFYRSGLVLAGAVPLWWQVPPEAERDYTGVAARLQAGRRSGERAIIDFGGVGHVPAEEFFGAAIWQLYKSIDSPYKAALKLLLMEVYAEEHPALELLSMRYKAAVYAGECDPDALDPYLQMYRKVERYLLGRGDTVRLNLARRSLYMKVQEKLSEPPRDGEAKPWRRELLAALVRGWGWDADTLRRLDERAHWPLDIVRAERQQLIQALSKSYHQLSAFTRGRGDAHISDRDLTVLGRRLYAAFERKAGKIDIITRGLSGTTAEPRLALVQTTRRAQDGWALYRGHPGRAEAQQHSALKRGQSVVELACWSLLNGLIGADTSISVAPAGEAPTAPVVKQLLARLEPAFPGGRVSEPPAAQLLAAPAVREATLFANLGGNPLPTTLERGDLLTSDFNDVLSFSGLRRNLVVSCDLVITNTWGEVFTAAYRGADALAEAMLAYGRWSGPAGAMPVPRIECFTLGYGPRIAERLRALFEDYLAALAGARQDTDVRYLFELGGRVHAVEARAGRLARVALENDDRLHAHLEAPRPRFCQTVLDRGCLRGELLREVLEANRRDTVQAVIVKDAAQMLLYVADENGSVLRQRQRGVDHQRLVGHLDRFLGAATQRIVQARNLRGIARRYVLASRQRQGWALTPVLATAPEPGSFCHVQALAETGEGGRTAFTIVVDGTGFSSLEHGPGFLREAARHVLARRRNGERYPIYITDMDLSPALLGEQDVQSLQTVHLLRYKRHIEARLNDALRRL